MSHNPRVSIQTKIAYPNATSEQHTFDAVYNIKKIETANQTIDYTHDKTGLIKSKNNTNYTYDKIGRLTQAGTDSFSYDKAGNNLNDNASYNPLNNRFKQSDLFTLACDAMGNVKTKYNKLTKETTTYTFNARNQLTQYVEQDENNNTIKTLSYTYDALGRRVSKTEDNTTQQYLYDGDDIVAILDSNNAVIVTITHDESIDTPLSITNANGTFYYHRDHQGSIVALTDENGNVVESFAYDNHYGAIISHTETVETNNPYGYTGREVDADDLYYYRARYYDPTIQRFLSEDPIGFASGDFNRYRYVDNSPVNWADFTGLAKHDPNSAYCQSLRKKMQNIQKDIQKRYNELEADKLKLPKVKKGTKLYETIKGHEIIITQLRRRYYELADKYDKDCGGGGNPTPQPSSCSNNVPYIEPNKDKNPGFSPLWMLPFLPLLLLGSLAAA